MLLPSQLPEQKQRWLQAKEVESPLPMSRFQGLAFQLALKHYFTSATTKIDPNRAGFAHFEIFWRKQRFQTPNPHNHLTAKTIPSWTNNKNDLAD